MFPLNGLVFVKFSILTDGYLTAETSIHFGQSAATLFKLHPLHPFPYEGTILVNRKVLFTLNINFSIIFFHYVTNLYSIYSVLTCLA